MKLLILTQKVDMNDDVLGFFHGWVAEFAKHCEQVTVIALGVGEYDLPKNVRVFSLGKEKDADLRGIRRGLARTMYFVRFYRYIWRERENYDTVFVHMNQEYVLLGGIFWKILGKKITLWRNHYVGSLLTRIAVLLCNHVFCTSKYSYTARFKKTSIMPVGIDTDIFKRDASVERKNNSILFLGRISPVKNVDTFIEALKILDSSGVVFVADIYGDAADKDTEYYKKVRESAAFLGKKGMVVFHPGVPPRETPRIYNQHELFVNATQRGSFDKTILEAMACECLVVASNESVKNMFPEQFLPKERNVADLAKRLRGVMSLLEHEKEEYRKNFRHHAVEHNLTHLADTLSEILATLKKHVNCNM
ncbi:MAG: Glycosyltransferase [Parcubacteria group bacterium GW2011_GWA1_47_8]|nr:MAG: Glycosyltransferase [Parcubacteria group bacterium GW2011_GWA1_47_8]